MSDPPQAINPGFFYGAHSITMPGAQFTEVIEFKYCLLAAWQ